jgi:hypothetical protein
MPPAQPADVGLVDQPHRPKESRRLGGLWRGLGEARGGEFQVARPWLCPIIFRSVTPAHYFGTDLEWEASKL